MFPSHVFTERREFEEKIAHAPQDYLRDNAAALLRIVWELQASLALELQVIQGVKRLDPADRAALAEYHQQFKDYVDRHDYNLERTSCGRIGKIYREQIRNLELAPGGPPRAAELEQLLIRFAENDAGFTEEIEPFMTKSVDVVEAMLHASSADDAGALQRRFSEEYDDEVQRLKTAIKDMNRVGNSLLDKL